MEEIDLRGNKEYDFKSDETGFIKNISKKIK
jgi:hypothetical protein